MKELKKIDFSQKYFTANGRKYFWSNSLSLNRWIEFTKIQPRLTFGTDFEGIYKNLELSVDMANKGKGIEAWNIILNLRNGIKDKLENRLEPALNIAALFINREDEDITKIDNNLFEEKIKDWTEEGLDTTSFFSFAVNTVIGFTDALQEISQNISAEKAVK